MFIFCICFPVGSVLKKQLKNMYKMIELLKHMSVIQPLTALCIHFSLYRLLGMSWLLVYQWPIQ